MTLHTTFVLTCLGATALFAQDVLKVAPAGTVKVEYEDNQVRVLRFKEAPGTKMPMHSHPPYVAVSLTDDVSQYTSAGKTTEQTAKVGQVNFSPAVTHASLNKGSTPAEAIMVELKGQPAGVNLTGEGDMVKGNPDACKVEVDNDRVRVTRVTVPAHGSLAMHAHPSENVVVYVTGGHVKATSSDGKVDDLTIAPGTVRVNQPGKHANENLGDRTTEAIVIELK